MIHKHTITLWGPAASEPGISGHLLRDLFDVLVQGAEQSLRFRIEGRSSARGAVPAWLRDASDFQMIDLASGTGARTMRVEARALVDSMPDRFAQRAMFDDLDATRSPIELFEDALEEALLEKTDSEAFDQPLLETCAKFRNLLGAGVDAVELVNGRTVRVDRDALERVTRLARIQYAPRKVRLAGRLDIIRYSDCRFTLVLQNGARVAGVAREPGAEALRGAFGTDVVVTGTAEFRPSGSLLRVSADLIEPARSSELELFGSLPRPLLAPAPVDRPGARGGLEALLGEWPGDESLEQLLGQLEQLS